MRNENEITLDGSAGSVPRARALVEQLPGVPDAVRHDVEVVLAELVSNACLHGEPPVVVRVVGDGGDVRVEVTDAGAAHPVRPRHDLEAMTGRGFLLVSALAQRWGVEPHAAGGKTVWAELSDNRADDAETPSGLDVTALPAWPDLHGAGEAQPLHAVTLRGIPTDLLLAAKSHIDDVVRELQLVQTRGDGDGHLPESVRRLVQVVTEDFAPARASIKRQAIAAAARGDVMTDLTLHLPLSAADAGERYLAALEEVDRRSRAGRMLTLALPRSHREFRRWYLTGIVQQLRAAATGSAPPALSTFFEVLTHRVDELGDLLEAQTRLQLLQTLTRRLTEARSVEEMAQIVVDVAATYEGVTSTRVFRLTERRTLQSVAWRGGAVAHDEFDELPLDADVPAAVAARTGEAVHAASVADIYAQFPRFARAARYPEDRSLHVVPLVVAGRTIGVLTLTFDAGAIGDQAQLDFVTAMADAVAQAVERASSVARADVERQRELALLAAQVDAMTGIVARRPLVDVLDQLLLAFESASPDGLIASVLLLDEDGRHLRHGSAPSLPASYNAAIDGIEIGPAVGSCGTAAYRRERVIVEDIDTDPLWASYRELAHEARLRACWSTPIVDKDGAILGTFALYYREPHRPSDADLAFIDVLVSTVALIIERSRAHADGAPDLVDDAAQRLALELAVTAGGVGTFDWNLITGDLVWDEQLLDIFGFADRRRVLTIDDFFAVVHPDDRDRVAVLLDRAVADVGAYDAEYRIVLPNGAIRWVTARGRAIAGADGSTARLIGAAHDATDRRDTETRVARVMDSLATAFFFLDPEWRFTFLNSEAERVLGRAREDLLGRVIWEEFPAAIGSEFETHYRRAAASNEPVAFDAYYPEPLNAWYEVRTWPTSDGLAVYFIDVTDRRTAQQAAQTAINRAGMLARVSEELARTLDPTAAMQSLAHIVCPELGDWCVVTLIDDDRHAGTRRGLGEALGWHNDPAKRAMVDRYAQIRLAVMTDHALITRAVETAEPQIVNGDAMIELRQMFAGEPEPLSILEELGTWAIGVLPLVGQEHPVGMLSVVRTEARGPFSLEDLGLLREVAARAGLVLDRARLYRQQREVSESLQRSLLHPPSAPADVAVAVRYVPAAEVAQVGGDWYDTFAQPDGSTTVVIGDVMGHDLLAAAAMGEARMLIRTLAAQHEGAPGRVLDDAEAVMELLRLDTLATVLVGRLERRDTSVGRAHRFRFANAGHPPPVVLHPDGTVSVLADEPVSPLLGVGSRPHQERVLDLPDGATLVLYTDGLVERRGQSIDDGIAQLVDALVTFGGEDPEQLCDRVLSHLVPGRTEDDVALLVVRIGDATKSAGERGGQGEEHSG